MLVNRKVMWFFASVILGVMAFFVYRYIGSHFWGLSYPQNSFFFLESARFTDFFEINELVSHMNPYQIGASYPPLALLFALLFAKMVPGTGSIGSNSEMIQAFRDTSVIGQTVVLMMYIIVILGIAAVFWTRFHAASEGAPVSFAEAKSAKAKCILFFDRYLAYGAIFAMVMLSAPVLFAADRGNYLIICVLFLLLFCAFYGKNDDLAAVFLALSACLKIYPVVLFLLFVLSRKWKPLAIGLSSGALLTGIGMALFRGDYLKNMFYFLKNVFAFSGGFDTNSSFYYRYATGFRSLIATPVLAVRGQIPDGFPISSVTLALSLVFLLLVVGLCVLDKRTWRQIFYLTAFMILFPTPSFYYNLTYLLAPLFLFLFKPEKEKFDKMFLIAFILLMIPKSYVYFPVAFTDGPGYTGIECFLNPLILCFMLVLSFVEVLGGKYAGRKNVSASVPKKRRETEESAT